ncbi:MAG: zinc-ribbon domain-containing protein [Spirochaetaceae bacterium]|nr:zinc-ribbon domain-containing protein [Spirochaetaceae bacterium]
MNISLLKILKEIVSRYGPEILSDVRRVKALLADLAIKESKPQKNALVACIEQGFPSLLKNVPASERGPAKTKLAERLNREEGLEMALCSDTLDLLEAVLFASGKNEETPQSGGIVCPSCGTALPEDARFCSFCGIAVATGAAGMEAAHPVPPPAPGQQSTPVQTKEVWRELHTLRGHAARVYSVAYSPDGRRIVSGSGDHTIRIWDAESGLHTLMGHHQRVYSVAYSSDGRRIVSGGAFGLKVWDAENGREPRSLTEHFGLAKSAAYSPDGRRIASGADDNTIRIQDAESGQELRILIGHADCAWSVVYSPDGRRIASGSLDETIKIWDAESGRELHTLRGHAGKVYSVAYSPDGRRIVSGSNDGTIKIWDAESGRELYTLKGHSGSVWSMAYSPDGRRIVSGSNDETIKIWDAESGRELHTLKGHSGSINPVAYSPDGRRIASGSDDCTIKIWGRE